MKVLARMGIPAALVTCAIVIGPGAARAQNVEECAWPIELSPEGFGNATSPDTAARYWLMPFANYDTMTLEGTYPHARFFSFVAYQTNSEKTPTGVIDGDLHDAEITPDPGSVNPFVEPGAGNGTYTIVISRAGQPPGNTITVSSDFAWLLLRMYVPDADPSVGGHNLMGGVPLPTVSVTRNGASQQLQPCSRVNRLTDVSALLQGLFPVDLTVSEGTPTSDRLWFAAPIAPPPSLLPNPENKYLGMFPGDYQPGRIIVIHGKAPGFPDTFHGSSIATPARGFRTVDLRYWSICEADLALPVPTVGCVTDLTADVVGGYYTIVISDDLLRPAWLRPNISWLPWGDEQYPKMLFFRNMLPSPDFHHSVQDAVAADPPCTFALVLTGTLDRPSVDEAGKCAQEVMGDYYPVATWCDKSTFVAGGVRACLKE